MTGPGEDDREAVDRAFAELVAGYHHTADRPDPLVVRAEIAAELAAPPVRAEVEDEGTSRYVPQPLPPLARPRLPALLGWLGLAYAAVLVLVAACGVAVPGWAGWVAVASFIGGFVVLLTQLPRQRPPEAGDGAVL